MLVYANYLPVRSASGLLDPLGPVATWVSKKLKRKITASQILKGGDFAAPNGWSAASTVAVDQYPHLAAFALVHPDSDVAGRRWHTEVGLRQRQAGADVELTVLVQTSEISSRVTAPVSPGAPTFVSELLRCCEFSSTAIGCTTKTLDDESGEAFRHVILDPSRQYPFVVVSPTRDGSYLVDTDWLRQSLLGIAELVVIPPSADTFWLARTVGEEFIPYRGAIKTILPSRNLGQPSVRTLPPKEIESENWDPRSAAKELFSLVLHRTNVPLSWQHISPTRVKEVALRREFERKRAAALASGISQDYVSFLEAYVKDMELSIQQAAADKKTLGEVLDSTQRAADETQRELRSKIASLQLLLENSNSPGEDSPYASEDILKVADAVADSIDAGPSPEECLLLIDHLFPDRVVILPEAWTSARESGGFKHGRKLYSLLNSLSTAYWRSLRDGIPDQEARKVFGAAYAAKESETVTKSKGARRKRTFRYRNEDYYMAKHLKIGVKESPTECIRVHFEWIAARNLLVIGHCGQHLPFD
jgi:hypothetical protein